MICIPCEFFADFGKLKKNMNSIKTAECHNVNNYSSDLNHTHFLEINSMVYCSWSHFNYLKFWNSVPPGINISKFCWLESSLWYKQLAFNWQKQFILVSQ